MRISVGAKLLGGLGLVLLLYAVVGVLAIANLAFLSELAARMYAVEVKTAEFGDDARIAAARFRTRTILAVTATDAAERASDLAARQEWETAFKKALGQLQPLVSNAEGRSLLNQVEAAWGQYKPLSDQAVAAAQAGNAAEANRLIQTTLRERYRAVDDLLDRFTQFQSASAAEAAADAARTYEQARNLTIALLLFASLVGVGVGLWLARTIGHGLRTTAETAGLIAAGDLTRTVTVRTRDEVGDLGEAFNRMVAGLRELTAEIRDGAQSLAGATSEILTSITQQGSSTTEQAAAVNQTTATIEEARMAAQQAVQKAHAVAAMSQRATEVVAQGLGTVETTVARMQEIRARVEAIAEQILALSEQTQQIGEITTTVDDLADQSNLLAVNAAIEASRAGEQGRGFAVVAQEVRSLAERSKAATVQVRTILTDIQRATNAAVLATEQGTKDAEEGAKLVEQAGQAIRKLAETIRESAEAAQQIVAAAGQQGVGMDQIATAMANINQATTETAAGTRQLQKAAENINLLAQRLTDLVGRYKLDGRVGRLP
ncbi:MAG: methyl-accepting chemotaxis protein [Chloroflexi bacterium]|nr:methyl-accepting chemotaxis protein [Chloroflexota bacterium]